MGKSRWQRERERRAREARQTEREQQRFVAAEKRESARRQREAQRAEARADRERRAMYAAERQAEAKELAAATDHRQRELANILSAGVQQPATLAFDAMRAAFVSAEFSLGELGVPATEPRWDDFSPPQPGWFTRLFSSGARRSRAQQEARLRYEQEITAHQRREQHRLAELDRARQQHQRRQDRDRKEADANNTHVETLRSGYFAKDQGAVEQCVSLALNSRTLPEGIPREVEVAYRSDSAQILVLRDLPDVDIIPSETSFRYVKIRDTIESSKTKSVERRRRYEDMLAQLGLLTLHDVFTVTTAAQVDEATVNCHLRSTNKATGAPARPCLLTVSSTRDQFDSLVLDKVEPRECLRYLNALMSPNPYDVEQVKPIFNSDLTRFRIVDAQDIAARLDSRTVLVEQSPVEFEVLVKQLFEAMGMESWVTQASRDDGVDAVALNPDRVMGGLCVIQAKRYVNVVPADAVRALWGVMEDKKAGTGVLVTTSYFGKATHDFAQRNERVRLIEGPELKYLINEHLSRDVIVGAKRPPKARD